MKRPRMATVRTATVATLIEVPRETLEESLQQSFQVGLARERLASNRLGAAV